MKVRILQGLFSLFLLLVTTTATAETLIIDFTADIMEVESPLSPMEDGDTVVGHVEIDSHDFLSEDYSTPGEAEFLFSGPNTFGNASASPSGWSFPTLGVLTAALSVEDNYVVDSDDMSTVPSWVTLPTGFGVGSVIDTLGLEVETMNASGLFDSFELFAVFLAGEEVVDLNRDGIIDFDKLFAAAFHIGFYAEGDLGTPPDIEWWGVEGTAAATASVVPVPAAAWLFGSGLLGLVGAARRKRVTA